MIRAERIDRVIDEAIESRRLVGAVVMVAHKGTIAYRRAAGFADREAGLPWPAGTTSWGGIYGHVWSIDPASDIAMVSMTNTALYGGEGAFPQRLREAVYAD